jgi:hypothetical protein
MPVFCLQAERLLRKGPTLVLKGKMAFDKAFFIALAMRQVAFSTMAQKVNSRLRAAYFSVSRQSTEGRRVQGEILSSSIKNGSLRRLQRELHTRRESAISRF